ncbi:hypothetical protein, partial [Microbulbifer sp. 2205BS26-8]|uniref:hypothetical protein n=1 Tax=Microbulbifer sp. 2205BS26-8 TaxID=3064386 RepID=UPI00273EF8A8
MRLFLIVLLMLSNAVFALGPPPEEDLCREWAPPVYNVTLPTSDADGSYILTFVVPSSPCGIEDAVVEQSINGGSYARYTIRSSSGSNSISFFGKDSALYRYRIKTISTYNIS